MPVAITREVSSAIGACELTHLQRVPIDVDTARTQHAAYESALATMGCHVQRLPAQPGLPDSVFVEDVAVVLDELAILTRPGAESRRRERRTVEQALAPHRNIVAIQAPGTVDGGDVLVSGRNVWIGLTSRSNQVAINQFRAAVANHGYRVHEATVNGCLHLKSAVTAVSDDLLVVNPDWVDITQFVDHRCLAVDPSEPGAANVVRIGDAVLAGSAFPRTAERLAQTGLNVQLVDTSELAKAEGALTCCSLIFEDHTI